jgi:HEAT repeat protein
MDTSLPPGGRPSDLAIGVLTVDHSLCVRTWSAWLEQVSGISSQDACGRSLQEVLPDLDSRGLLARFARVLETGEAQVLAPAFHHYLIACPPREPSRYFQFMQQLVTLGPLREHNRVAGVMATVEDVTARLDADRALAADLQSDDPATRQRAAELVGASGAAEPGTNFSQLLRHHSWQVRRDAVHGIARHASPELVASLIEALREEHRDFNVLSSALQLLSMIDVDVAAPLAELLRHPDPDLRIQAAHALGDQASPDAVPPLLGALRDSDANVRFHAIESLGRLHSSDAVDALAAIAESRDFFLAFPAVEALARIDDPRVAPRLTVLLDDEALCEPAAEALGRLGNGDMTRKLVAVLDRPQPPVTTIATAIVALHAAYERRYGGGAYIVSEFQQALTAAGMQRLLDALRDASKDELRALVVLLGWVQSPAVAVALTELLGRPEIRGDVVEALVRHGSTVVDRLIEQLRSDDENVRSAAVVALGRLGDSRATEPLIGLLSLDRTLAVAAAGALASIGDRRAFDPLFALLGHSDATVRQAVTAALNSLGHPEMESRIAPLLQSEDPRLRESAVRVAGYFGYPACADALFERCRDRDESVRRAALEHAPYIGESRALPVLIDAVAHDTPRARATAATALGQITGAASRAALIGALSDSDSWVRYFAARALGTQGDAEPVDALGRLAANDEVPHVRIAALQAIGAIDGRAAADLLLAHADDADPAIAAAALTSLGRVSDGRAVGALNRALRSADPQRRQAAIRAFSQRGGADSVTSLRWAVESDSTPDLAEAALDGMARLARLSGEGWTGAIDALVDLTALGAHRAAATGVLAAMPPGRVARISDGLTHPNPHVRRATIETLTRMKHPEASARVRSALDDGDEVVREAAVIALDRIGARGIVQKLAAIVDSDPAIAVRRAAQVALARYTDRETEGGAAG